MRVKRLTIEDGKRIGISRFPNFHKKVTMFASD